jgi:serine/threonine-protein kinase
MAPEQLMGAEADARSDVYALCVLFHEFLCLEHYLGAIDIGDLRHAVTQKAAPHASFARSAYQHTVPVDLGWFVDKGLQKDPAKRYQTVAEMIERLERRSEGEFPIQCHITLTKRVAHAWLRFVDAHPALWTVAGTVWVLRR